jgi:hypothetical protein
MSLAELQNPMMAHPTLGAEPVNLDKFRKLLGSTATGVDKSKIGNRLTNLLQLNVNLNWYTQYRSEENPDLGTILKGPFNILNEPAVPLNDTDTPPTTVVPSPPIPAGSPAQRIQAIANTAGFHFAFIEQGGTSLYPTLALKANSDEVLRILISIGGVEIDHFSLWHDKAGNAVAQPLAGVTDPKTGLTFPNLNDPATLARLHLQLELTQTNKILPEPCDFLEHETLPPCSVIRPTSTRRGLQWPPSRHSQTTCSSWANQPNSLNSPCSWLRQQIMLYDKWRAKAGR